MATPVIRPWVAAIAAGALGLAVGITGSAVASSSSSPAVEKLDQIIALAEAAKADLAEPTPTPTVEPTTTTTTTTPPPTTTTTTAAVSKQGIIDAAGPRATVERTLTASEAKAELLATGLLERVEVTGMLNLSDVNREWTIRDSVVDAGGASYGIRTKVGYSGVTPPDGVQRIEHVEVHGASSAGLYLRDVTVVGADVWGNVDNIKSADRVSVTRSWLHDLHYNTGAHTDAIQIQYGVDQFYAENVISAIIGSSSDPSRAVGSMGSGGLQTGSMLGDASARFHDNWWEGGGYTVRMGDSGPPLIDYQFRRNRMGRAFTFGPTTGTRTHPTSFGGVRWDDSNVWDDTGQPV